jgi:hypothetical protein
MSAHRPDARQACDHRHVSCSPLATPDNSTIFAGSDREPDPEFADVESQGKTLAVANRPGAVDTESSKWPTKCSSEVQQPQRTKPTALGLHRPVDLRQRPSATFLPLNGKERVT